jgi:5'-deoxynucleotidase YfbR-like HD superfamily hydrolase
MTNIVLNSIIERVRAVREAGHVKRCHNMPIHGEYTVGKHSYDALSLLLVLHPAPGPSLNLVKATLWHDSGERWWGDLPAPAKWANAHLKAIYERAEQNTLEEHGIHFDLTADEKIWLNAVDKLEFWLFCLDQQGMGNRNVTNAYWAITNALDKAVVPHPVRAFITEFEWARGSENP